MHDRTNNKRCTCTNAGLGYVLEKILAAVSAGIDMFDSSYVTKMTDSGRALNFTFGEVTAPQSDSSGKKPKTINLWDPAFADDFTALSDGCKCYSCSTPHTRGYVHHLLNAHEMLGLVLLMRYVLIIIIEEHEYV
jgi:queuine tRNA-ribosyltransferase subunit QTRTD1